MIADVQVLPNLMSFDENGRMVQREPTKEERAPFDEEVEKLVKKEAEHERAQLLWEFREANWKLISAQLDQMRRVPLPTARPSPHTLGEADVGAEDSSEAALVAKMAEMCVSGLAASELDKRNLRYRKSKLEDARRHLGGMAFCPPTVCKTHQVEAHPEVVVREDPAGDAERIDGDGDGAGGERVTRGELAGEHVTKAVAKLKSKLAKAGVSAADFRCVFYFC